MVTKAEMKRLERVFEDLTDEQKLIVKKIAVDIWNDDNLTGDMVEGIIFRMLVMNGYKR
jgi:hypothetical protein